MSKRNFLEVSEKVAELGLDLNQLRDAISCEYEAVAKEPRPRLYPDPQSTPPSSCPG